MYNPRYPMMAAPDAGPDLDTPQGAAEYAEDWDSYVSDLDEALSQSAGFEREKLAAQLKDAEAGRANAYKIAQLQASTSRYGVDKNFESAMRQLKENARQFDANHMLEKEKFAFEKERFGKEFGLKTADSWVKYASSPDLMFQRADFEQGLERAGIGLSPAPYGSQGRPQPARWEDFAALAGFNTPAVQAGQTMPGVGAGAAVPAGGFHEGGAGPGGPATDVDGDGVPDPRPKAVRAIMDAIPPSEGYGTDNNDFAALQAIENVWRAAKPGTLQRMRPGQQAAFGSGLAKLRYYVPDALAELENVAPGQRSVRRSF